MVESHLCGVRYHSIYLFIQERFIWKSGAKGKKTSVSPNMISVDQKYQESRKIKEKSREGKGTMIQRRMMDEGGAEGKEVGGEGGREGGKEGKRSLVKLG